MQDSEIFRNLTVDGDFSVRQRLTLILDYEQPYPVDIAVACEVSEDNDGVRGQTVNNIIIPNLPKNPGSGVTGETTSELRTLQQFFLAPDSPGPYFIRCFTTADESNDIERIITITPGAGDPGQAP